MFPQISRTSIIFVQHRLCSTATAMANTSKSLGSSRVFLTGLVTKPPRILNTGRCEFVLTSNALGKWSTHYVYANRMHSNINVGQYLRVDGVLSSREFLTVKDKRRFQFSVAAMKTSIIKPTHGDTNLVVLNARSVTDIWDTIEYSSFRVLTTFKSRSQPTPIVHLFPVRIYDGELRNSIKQEVQKGSYIDLMGQLGSNVNISKEHQIKFDSFIRATSITIRELHAHATSTVSNVASEDLPLEGEYIADRKETHHPSNEQVLNGTKWFTSEPDLSLDWTEEELIAETKKKEQILPNKNLDRPNTDQPDLSLDCPMEGENIAEKKKDEIV